MPSGKGPIQFRRGALRATVVAIALFFGHAAIAQAPLDTSLVESVETVRITASGQRFVPRQSLTPGGAPKHTADYDVTVTWNPGGWLAREEWQLDTVFPVVTGFAYSMTYGELAGIKDGQDNFRAALDGPTPLSAARIGANFKDLWLTNPLILAANSQASLPPVEFASGGNVRHRIALSAHDTEWTLVIDPATGLPSEVTTMEQDPIYGQGPNRVVFSDWREVSGVPFPFQVEQFLNGGLLRREIRSAIEVNPTDAMVGAYVPDTRLFFNSDLYSPGRELHFPLSMNALFAAVRYHGLNVERHVGSHGMGYDSEPE